MAVCIPRGTEQLLSTVSHCDDCPTRRKQGNSQLELFDQLNSPDALTVRRAEERINDLQDRGLFQDIALKSVWPVDTSALKQIALDQSESKHALLRERAFCACSYLVTNRYKEGDEAAAILASKKMQSGSETDQKEGLKYFVLLLEKWRPQLSQDDLVLAISIAKTICMTEQWLEAGRFFDMLVKHGQEHDVAQLKNTVLDLCASDNSHAFYVGRNICDEMVTKHHPRADLIEISLQGALSMCASEERYKNGQGLDLFWALLRWSPVSTIDPLLQALETESQRKNPSVNVLMRLNELAGHDFSNLLSTTKEAVLQRAKEDVPALLRILTNLSTCDSPYVQQQALVLKKTVESRVEKAQ